MRFKDVLDLTRAGILAAALFLLGGLLPVLGAPVMLCAPAPILIYAMGRSGLYWRILATLALAGLLIGAVAGPVQGIVFGLNLGLGTVLMALMLRRHWAFEAIVAVCTMAMLAATAAGLILWAGSPAALMRHLHEAVALALSHSAGFYEKLGISEAGRKQLAGRVLEIITQLAPAIGAMLGALTILINLGLLSRLMGKEKIGYQLFGGLVTWRTPEWLIWILLASGFGMFIPLEGARVAALNVFVLVAAIYFCQGLAIMAYYLRMLAMPSIVRGAIYLITLMQPVLAALVCLAGVFDMWIDFRRLKPPSQEAGSIDDFF